MKKLIFVLIVLTLSSCRKDLLAPSLKSATIEVNYDVKNGQPVKNTGFSIPINFYVKIERFSNSLKFTPLEGCNLSVSYCLAYNGLFKSNVNNYIIYDEYKTNCQ